MIGSCRATKLLILSAGLVVASGCGGGSTPLTRTRVPTAATSSTASPVSGMGSIGFVASIGGSHHRDAIQGALVRILDGALAGTEVLTDSTGIYKLPQVSDGITVSVVKTGYLTAVGTLVAGSPLGFVLVPAERSVQPLGEGEHVRSNVTSLDPLCDTGDTRVEELDAPCRTYQITPSRSGTLVAELTWIDREIFMELLTPSVGKCCTSPIRLQIPVIRGVTYTLNIGFHGTTGAEPKGSAQFELTTSIVP